MTEHLGHTVRPAGKEARREHRLERLHRRAGFEPCRALAKWHTEDRGPWSLVCYFDRRNRINERPYPVLNGGAAKVKQCFVEAILRGSR
jgi:hypothetical protein